jgi:predicted permease
MSWWRKFRRGKKLEEELAKELQFHLEESKKNLMAREIDAQEARRQAVLKLGGLEQTKERVRDQHLVPWLDSLRADVTFAFRQLAKNKITSAAAIISLALAIGACTSAFRLVDALFLRPLPVAHPERLYGMTRQSVDLEGQPETYDSFPYPLFRQMRAAVKDRAELMAVSYSERTDLTYKSDAEMENAYLQYVSGWTFDTLGLQPALGRLLNEEDDQTPGGHPLAVISYDYWKSRFGGDPDVLSRTFRIGNDIYQIVGVGPKGFAGTETGTPTDIVVPITMNVGGLECMGCGWFRLLMELKPDTPVGPVADQLQSLAHAFQEFRAKGMVNVPALAVQRSLQEKLVVAPAPAGVSELQKDYQRPLIALSALVALVLFIACANVANLLTAQGTARAREMALRVSIGAGRLRLMQLVLVESGVLAVVGSILGAFFAWWSAPFVVSKIDTVRNPARLALPADWRVLLFVAALCGGVAILFGLFPALRAASVKPIAALKGGELPRSRGRVMYALIGAQVAFCFLVLFLAGLFLSTFEKLSSQPIGFSPEGLLVVDTVSSQPRSPVVWQQVAEQLRNVPGIENVAIAGWPLLTGRIRNNQISVNGGPPSNDLAFYLNVSPGWLETMRIPLLSGRDFRPGEADPAVAIVSQSFANRYFPGENPIGKLFAKTEPGATPHRYEVVGLVPDARYRDLRGPMLTVFYVPFASRGENAEVQAVGGATILARASGGNPMGLAATLRREVPRVFSEFRVSNIRTQQEIVDVLTVRERLLATLATFFSVVALLLAAIGLYGVLYYSVLQRRREIAIRLAIGAQAPSIARLVMVPLVVSVGAGAVTGLLAGLFAARYVADLLYRVRPTDLVMLVIPAVTITVAAAIASLPAVIRAVQTEPASVLRAE